MSCLKANNSLYLQLSGEANCSCWDKLQLTIPQQMKYNADKLASTIVHVYKVCQ